jgi:hypothetical protein
MASISPAEAIPKGSFRSYFPRVESFYNIALISPGWPGPHISQQSSARRFSRRTTPVRQVRGPAREVIFYSANSFSFLEEPDLVAEGRFKLRLGPSKLFRSHFPRLFPAHFAITLLFPPTFGVWETRQKAIVSLISFVFSMREGHLSIPSDYLFHEFR